MKKQGYFGIILFLITAIFSTSCKQNPSGVQPEFKKSLEVVDDVSLIPGGEHATIIVNRGEETYFTMEFTNISENPVIANGTAEGWCIEWLKPFNSNNGIYSDIKLYSTDIVESWKPLNYLLNIKEGLLANDPDLSYREIQLVIWSLRVKPEFNLEKIALEDLPSGMRTNGHPNFSYEKVKEILRMVDAGNKTFNFSAGTKFAVIAETPSDVQTLITVVVKK